MKWLVSWGDACRRKRTSGHYMYKQFSCDVAGILAAPIST